MAGIVKAEGGIEEIAGGSVKSEEEHEFFLEYAVEKALYDFNISKRNMGPFKKEVLCMLEIVEEHFRKHPVVVLGIPRFSPFARYISSAKRIRENSLDGDLPLAGYSVQLLHTLGIPPHRQKMAELAHITALAVFALRYASTCREYMGLINYLFPDRLGRRRSASVGRNRHKQGIGGRK